jgi:Reverse transcriptase (RNA-dependent DNA polymerase)/gag-polypeptide of LTR copia-type/Integrase core domain/GAG-pre-integrase domain
MAPSDDTRRVPVLNKISDYTDWSARAKAYLMTVSCTDGTAHRATAWQIVGPAPAAVVVAPAANAPPAPPLPARFTPLQEEKALGELLSLLSPHLMRQQDKVASAREVWAGLLAKFVEAIWPTRNALKDQLNDKQQRVGQLIDDYFLEVQELNGKLKYLGKDLDDEELVDKLLRSVAPEFLPAITAIAYSGVRQDLTQLQSTLNDAQTRNADARALGEAQHAAFRAQQFQPAPQQFQPAPQQFQPAPQQFQPAPQHMPQLPYQPPYQPQLAFAGFPAQGGGGHVRPRQPRGPIRCMYCLTLGHRMTECPDRSAGRPPGTPTPAMLAEFPAPRAGARNHAAMHAHYGAPPPPPPPGRDWLLDSGTSSHMSPHKCAMLNYRPVPARTRVRFGAGHESEAPGMGDIDVATAAGVVRLFNVLHVPELVCNLFSLPAALKDRMSAHFLDTGHVWLERDARVVLRATLRSGLFWVDLAPASQQPGTSSHSAFVAASVRAHDTAELWHRRFGHSGSGTLAEMARKGLIQGSLLTARDFLQMDQLCEPCVMAKMHRAPHPAAPARTTRPAQLIHLDTMGPLETAATGERYAATALDDFTGLGVAVPVHRKSDVPAVLKDVVNLFETQSGQRVQRLRTDNGGEFLNGELASFTRSKGIEHETSAPYTAQQNGKIERMHRTIGEKTRANLKGAGLPANQWPHAMRCASVQRNCVPGAGRRTSPLHRWNGRHPDVSRLRVFGSKAYAHVPIRSKLQDKAVAGVMVGYAGPVTSGPTGNYKVLMPNGSVKVVNAVTFDEGACVAAPPPALPPSPILHAPPAADDDLEGEHAAEAPAPADPVQPAVDAAPAPVLHEQHAPLDAAGAAPAAPAVAMQSANRPARERRAPERYDPSAFANAAQVRTAATVAAPSAGGCGGVSGCETQHPPPVVPPPTAVGAHRRRVHFQSVPPSLERRARPVPTRALSRGRDPAMPALAMRLRSHAGSPPPPVPADALAPAPSTPQRTHDSAATERGSVQADMQRLETWGADPVTLEEAYARPDAHMWRAAVQEELDSLNAFECWRYERLPQGKRALGCRWVLERKRCGRYKARLVVQGFQQVHGVDYDATYAPVCGYSTLRALLAVSAHEGLVLRQFDIRTAFLNGALEEEVYMRQPPGHASGPAGSVCRLQRALYGLKQAGRKWHETLVRELLELGFTQSDADPSLFLLRGPGGCVLALFYVDDGLVAAKTAGEADALVARIGKVFNIRALGEPSDFLGINIVRDWTAGTISIDQSDKVLKMAARFGIAGESRTLPMDPSSFKLLRQAQPGETLAGAECSERYPELLGVLGHLAQCTRPDIALAVGVLASFTKRPTAKHWGALLDVARYVVATHDWGITYGHSAVPIESWVDASFANCLDTRRSITGYVNTVYGGAVSWSSKKQPTVALSTQEAEYQAMGQAAREVMHLRKLYPELGVEIDGPVHVFGDNQAALLLADDRREGARSKHIDIIHHYSREHRKKVKFVECRSAENLSDCFTKALPRPALSTCLAGLGVGARAHFMNKT